MSVAKILEGILASGVFRPAKDCHLWVWAPNNFVPDAIWLIEQLGFRYITMATWVKPSRGLGQYFGHTTEQLLFAVRGNGIGLRKARKRASRLTTSIVADRRRGEDGRVLHSGKPEESYLHIEIASPPPRLEMFARRRRPGWDVWGDEIPAPGENARPSGAKKR